MKTSKTALAVLLLTVAATLTAAQTGAPAYVPGELIVKLEHGIVDWQGFEETPITSVPILYSQLEQALVEYQVRSVERVFKGIFATPPFRFVTKNGREVQLEDLSQVYLFRMSDTLDMEVVAAQFEKLPGVIYAEPDYICHPCTKYPNDPDFERHPPAQPWEYQWGLHHKYPGLSPSALDVNAVKSWSIETGDRDILLAILDSGLEDDHYDEEGDEFYDRVVLTRNWKAPPLDDPCGHGTHITGIAAAATNSGYGEGDEHGIAGVAGGWSGQGGVELAIAKIADEEGAHTFHIVSAIEWATSKNVDVLNCSYGSSLTLALGDAIKNAFKTDMTLFFASGNSGKDSISHPAKLAGTDWCCAVGAMNQYSQRWSNSSYGDALSFVAPGVYIRSTYIDPSYYDSLSGTSTASPHAAGVSALLHSADLDAGYNLTDVDCKRIMEHTARDIEIYGVGWDNQTGWGCVDAWEGLRHFYWPYELEHGTVPNSQLQQQLVAEDIRVDFLGDMSGKISAGTYFGCDKYQLSGNISFTNNFEETPWFWERMLSVPTGYVGESVNPDQDITAGKFQIKSWNLASTGVDFRTNVYYVGHCYDVSGRKIEIHKWVPYAPSEVQVAYTALGHTATKTIHSPSISSSNYGMDSDLAVDFVHPDVPNAVHISYLDRENEDLRYIIDNFNGFTNSEVVDSDGNVGWYSSIALDLDGYPHISYHDATYKIAKHAWKDASGWRNEPLWTDVPSFGGLHTSIAISQTGLIQACFFVTDFHEAIPEPCNGEDLVWVYRNEEPPYNWMGGAVDVEGDVGRWCSLAVGPDGKPHISYYDATNGALKYATVDQGDWNTTTVDNSGDVGEYTSIAVDKLGGVHISYYDYTNDALKYAYKAQGVGSWQVETAYEYLGMGTSICIDDDGRPVIVYGGSDTDIRCMKKTTSGWVEYPIDWGDGYAVWGTSVGIDNLGRMVATYHKDDKLKVARRMRWPQESGYGTMMAGNNAGVGEELRPSIPMEPEITAVIPNPTTGAATIRYHIPRTTDVDIAVYDVAGREVTSLVSGEQSAGEHELIWEGRDNTGRQVPSGVYFIRMEAGNHQSRKKLTLLR